MAGTKLGRIPPRNAGEVVAVHLDHGEVRQRIGADQLGGEHAAIAHGNAHVNRAIDHVIVGHDVAVGRDDDAAADAVLNLRPLLMREVETRSEEPAHFVWNFGLRLVIDLGL